MKKILHYFTLFAFIIVFWLNPKILLSQVLPDNWTGDTDIDTYQESTTVHGGSYSCKVVVNSGAQKKCDMRNDEISVNAGDSYTYSFWGYTSAHVKIRSVLEWTGASITYGSYLAANSGDWTQLTVTGTVPSGATGVKVGVRFYDVSGFTPGEIQYIDDFTFESPTGTPLTLLNGDMESWPSSSGPDNPATFSASTVSTSEIDLSWTPNGNGDDVMVAWSSDGTFGTPVDGTTYSAGDAIPGGGTVLYNGNNTTYNHTGLTSGTQYFYKAWSVDGSTAYSSGITDDATTYKEEPTNYPNPFSAGTPGATSIPLTWDDNDGTVAADYFLVMINTTGSFTPPVDGTPQADDLDVSDGAGVVNVAHGVQAYTWTGLDQSTHYYFTIYPYTNSGSAINYKTDGTPPTTNAITTTANTDLIISEVADPNDNYHGRFVELYNVSASTIDFSTDTWYLVRQANGGSYGHVQLSGSINSGEAYTIGYSNSDFNGAYGFDPDLFSGIITGSGNDGYFLYFGGDESSGTLIDAYGVTGQDGNGTDWEYTNGKAVRKRSVGSPNSTWTASEWVITKPANVVNMTPGQHFNYVTWQGTSDQYWNTKANWDNGFIPDASMDVTIPDVSSTTPPEIHDIANVWDLTLQSSGQLTVKTTGQLTVYGDLSIASSKNRAAADLTIESDNSGQGSLIAKGSVSGNVSVKNYVTAGQWHSIASPVSGETANAYYLGGSPDVWLKEYNEATRSYTYITSLSTSLGDMKGWMVWVGGSTAETFTLNGTIHSGTLGSSNNMVRSVAGVDYGYNFVGNPFTSAIDWDATSGWTKTNLEDAIYVYNNGNWASYSGGQGTNGGTQYIAMNQGFFVQVSDGNNNGTLQMTNDVCVHNDVSFLKATSSARYDDILRLQVDNDSLSDETIIRLDENATEGWDSNLDAHKLFSFNQNRPQIFSTANGLMSINSLPLETGSVAIDVTGKDGDMLTIQATQYSDFSNVYLTDEYNGTIVDLTKTPYTFIYNATITNRFTISFTVTGLDNSSVSKNYYNIYSVQHSINIIQPIQSNTEVTVFNLLGQKVAAKNMKSTFITIPLKTSGYYIVRVSDEIHIQTDKVFVK